MVGRKRIEGEGPNITEKEFTQGFVNDIADLLKLCIENNTDSVTLNQDFGKGKLTIDITFSVSEKLEE